MKSQKGFLMLAGGIYFLISALATAGVVAVAVNSKEKAPAVAEVSQDANAPLLVDLAVVPSSDGNTIAAR